MTRALLAVLCLSAGFGCAGSLDNVPPKFAEGLEGVKALAVSADGLEKLACTEPGKSAINAELVKTGVVEPGALDTACSAADAGLDVGYVSINQLVDIYNSLNGTAE